MSEIKLEKRNEYGKMIQYSLYTIILLYFGRPLFVPLFVALLISFILYPLCSWQERHKIPKGLAILLSLSLFTILFLSILALLTNQFLEFMTMWPQLTIKLSTLVQNIDVWISSSKFNFFIDDHEGLAGRLTQYVAEYILPMIPKTLYSSSVSLVLLLLIPAYSALILYYRDVLVAFLYSVFPSSYKHIIQVILPDVIKTYFNFIKGMGLVYLIVGVLNSIGLALIGIPNPIFFGFMASVLTFIPYVGITMGALMPITVSWLVYDSIYYPLGVIVVFVVVQILEANIIFPLAVSGELKINALMTLIVIIGGGIVWGALGMVLFLPFAAILKLIADQIESMRPIAILLGTKNDIHVTKCTPE